MTTESVPLAPGGDARGSLSHESVDAFATWLRDHGYTDITARQKRGMASAFARWTRARRIGAAALDESAIDVYLADDDRPRRPAKAKWRRATLLLFHEYLRCSGGVTRSTAPHVDQCPGTPLQARYERYLRAERGLADKSIQVYRPFVQDLLAARFCAGSPTRPDDLSAQDVRDFLLGRIRGLSPASAKSVATALRSFLRFLFLRGETGLDLSLAIPTVRCTRGRKVHPYLRPDEVNRLLGACDAATAAGRRDHAVLLLLARLGLRSSEVVALLLDDILWRTGKIVVRGKGRVVEHLPLLPDIGEALAVYVREVRGRSDSRRVFLRLHAPREGLVGSSAVGAIVRRALARAGLRPPIRGAHILRYSLATTMIRHGASMAEIGEVLRHRSAQTTEIYAKVDFEALRGVARAWPGTGGGR